MNDLQVLLFLVPLLTTTAVAIRYRYKAESAERRLRSAQDPNAWHTTDRQDNAKGPYRVKPATSSEGGACYWITGPGLSVPAFLGYDEPIAKNTANLLNLAHEQGRTHPTQ